MTTIIFSLDDFNYLHIVFEKMDKNVAATRVWPDLGFARNQQGLKLLCFIKNAATDVCREKQNTQTSFTNHTKIFPLNSTTGLSTKS